HGAWIDCDQDIDLIVQEIHQLYITSYDPNVIATVCQNCGHIKLYEHDTCTECGSDNVKQVPSAEEYAIHDYEGFGPFTVSEYSSVVEIARMAEILTNSDSDDNKYAISFLAGIYDDLGIIQNKLEEVQIFHGSRGDYAQELTECCYDVPEYLFYYINYDAMGRDMEINGEISEIEHDIYVTNAQGL
ncbi:MAG: hypothetical protein DRQ39_01900, partial [Gammaproteobacteria bacterium]